MSRLDGGRAEPPDELNGFGQISQRGHDRDREPALDRTGMMAHRAYCIVYSPGGEHDPWRSRLSIARFSRC